MQLSVLGRRPHRSRRTARARASTAVALAVLGTLAAYVPSAAAAPAPESTAGSPSSAVRVSGTAGTTLTKDFIGFAGDDVRIEIDARTAVNGQPAGGTGHFHVVHRHVDGRLVADFTGDITCLVAGGRDAIATGVITGGQAPWFPGRQLLGTRVSLTLQDNGRTSRAGWLWGALGAPVSDCQGTVPFIGMTHGHFTVRG
ncbi:hypothetical protein [Kitasatospora sp. GP82]|uniref:hypothetical protein n=1 Tax=Kitasatospora sp. GP82 TaxID=3035089 RepID=UPI00247526F3|nr:hypothetical protein [Kitasatospora sp. GP82]MDH6128086.1 hypothetical protein [Kitasatospora sp. GP82]